MKDKSDSVHTPHREPPKHKTSVVVWLAIYPLITLILWVFGPVLAGIPAATHPHIDRSIGADHGLLGNPILATHTQELALSLAAQIASKKDFPSHFGYI